MLEVSGESCYESEEQELPESTKFREWASETGRVLTKRKTMSSFSWYLSAKYVPLTVRRTGDPVVFETEQTLTLIVYILFEKMGNKHNK